MTLFINCCPRRESRTKRLADAVLAKLGDYEELKLCETELLPVDEDRLMKRYALLENGQLDDPEFALARQFAAADRIVIAAPFWDLSFPAKLKLYLENIYITGIVSAYDETGMPKGLCRGNELIYVTTAGGPYDGRFSYEYLKTLCRDFFGIPGATLIKADMLDIEGNDPEAILDSAFDEIGFLLSGQTPQEKIMTDYTKLAKKLTAVSENVRYEITVLANASALLFDAMQDLNWCGFYLLRDGKLILGPFQGKLACTEIALGKGVCGTSAIRNETVLVKDVHAFEGHIACDSASNSEIVVPVHRNGELVGVLDIDSPSLARFTEEDRTGLERFVRALENCLP